MGDVKSFRFSAQFDKFLNETVRVFVDDGLLISERLSPERWSEQLMNDSVLVWIALICDVWISVVVKELAFGEQFSRFARRAIDVLERLYACE